MKYKKTSVLAMVLAVALVLGTTIAFSASARADGAPAPSGQDGTLRGYIESDDYTIMSYVNPDDGKTYYSFDGGETFEPLTDEEFAQRFPTPVVEWWTYDEYAAWLETEKAELQAMLGEKGWTGGGDEFVWTQDVIDETIAMYERILQEIKDGALYSKSVDGDTDTLLISGGADGFAFFKEGDTDGVQVLVVPGTSGTSYAAVTGDADGLTFTAPANNNVICFDSAAELEAHLQALDDNEAKGLNRYAGFEDMYASVDLSAPVIYVVE